MNPSSGLLTLAVRLSQEKRRTATVHRGLGQKPFKVQREELVLEVQMF